MGNRELANKLSSGEITQIKLGGTASSNLVVTDGELQSVADDVMANEIDINNNRDNIVDLSTAVSGLEDLTLYEFSKVQGSSTSSNTYSPLNALTVADAPAGTYEFKFTLVYTYSTTGRSAFFRVSDDNGVTWTELRREPKDGTDVLTGDFSYPTVHSGGDISLQIEFKTESNSDTLNVMGSNLVIERKA